jgi:multidrug efflux system membrane fusion protein
MKSLIKLIALLLVLAGGFWLYQRGGEPTKKAGKKDDTPVPVLTATADTRDLPVAVDLVGRGEAFESATITARIDGQVKDVLYQEGRPVKVGDVLLRLDPADYHARLKQAEANLARDQAQLQKAKADLERYRGLLQQGFVSAEKIADLEAALAAANAAAQAGKAALDLSRLQLSYTTVRAPIAGIVGARLVFPGTAVKTNETELARVNRIAPLLVSFALPEQHLAQVRARYNSGGLTARISAPDGPPETAPVRFVDHAVDPGTGTLLMKAELNNRDGRFAPGQYLRIDLVLDTLKNAVTVPAEAIRQGPKGSVVYVVKPDNGVDIRPVQIAAERAGQVALAKGVQAGETVVIDGHLRLTPKSKVTAKPVTK